MQISGFSKMALLIAATSFCLNSGSALARQPNQPAGLADGPGLWMNIWKYPQSGEVDAYCQKLHSYGVRNLFVQSSRSNTDAIAHPKELSDLIDGCHRYKIRVIAWSFAELTSPSTDAEKLIAAANFRSASGQRIDAIAADLEKNLSVPSVEAYSERLRAGVGKGYPMIAVVYSPLNRATEVAHIPWKSIDRYYDVIAPMNYWNGKRHQFDSFSYTTETVKQIRSLVGRSDVEIHVIGDGMGTHSDSIEQFFKACANSEVTSASLYPNQTCTAEQFDVITHYSNYFPVNSRFRLAAYRELIGRGALEAPPGLDPSLPIKRGQFYSLLVHQLSPDLVAQANTQTQAAITLANLNLIPAVDPASGLQCSAAEALLQPITTPEALRLIAGVVENRTAGGTRSAHRPANRSKVRPDRWLVSPAYAETKSTSDAKLLNYLDAAQIVLEASSGLP